MTQIKLDIYTQADWGRILAANNCGVFVGSPQFSPTPARYTYVSDLFSYGDWQPDHGNKIVSLKNQAKEPNKNQTYHIVLWFNATLPIVRFRVGSALADNLYIYAGNLLLGNVKGRYCDLFIDVSQMKKGLRQIKKC